jgi:hypothetical protein
MLRRSDTSMSTARLRRCSLVRVSPPPAVLPRGLLRALSAPAFEPAAKQASASAKNANPVQLSALRLSNSVANTVLLLTT